MNEIMHGENKNVEFKRELPMQSERYAKSIVAFANWRFTMIGWKLLPLPEIKEYAQSEMETLWDEHKRLTNPEQMRVDLSDKLLALKKQLLHEAKQEW